MFDNDEIIVDSNVVSYTDESGDTHKFKCNMIYVGKFDKKLFESDKEEVNGILSDGEILDLIKKNLPVLEELNNYILDTVDLGYYYDRLFSMSWNFYGIQGYTEKIVVDIKNILNCDFYSTFKSIISKGTRIAFKYEHNDMWLDVTLPMLNAYYLAYHILSRLCEIGNILATHSNVNYDELMYDFSDVFMSLKFSKRNT